MHNNNVQIIYHILICWSYAKFIDRNISNDLMCLNKLCYSVLEIDPRESQASRTSFKPTIYGVQPPDKVALEDLCEPPVQCPECNSKEVKCSPSGVSLIDLISRWEIRPYGDTKYPMVNLTRSTGKNLSFIWKLVTKIIFI